MPCFAHSAAGRPESEWEPLRDHLSDVGALASGFAKAFDAGQLGLAAGLLHDIGKCSAEFQRYISVPGAPRPDHSTAGAIEAAALYGEEDLGKLLAFTIAGHHAGLADGAGDDGPTTSLRKRLLKKGDLPDHSGWRDHVEGLPDPALIDTPPLRGDPEIGFSLAFLTRMLFSCLVDADSLATAAFHARARGEEPARIGWTIHAGHLERLREHMAGLSASAREVNRLRAQVLAHVHEKAAMAPGPFTLTVPTGGGKTLASLGFALDHALRHGLRRVIYVIPFTSIIEQTADVFRNALGALRGDVLEHHSSFDWEQAHTVAKADDEGPDGLRKLERAAENWDAPIVVTTSVQFFESLFAARRGRCRKLHNLAGSVIILDEAQKLPVELLRPCMAALEELYTNYRASVVLCTATQPALARRDGALPVDGAGNPIGLDISPERELAPDPEALYARLKRVSVEWRADPVNDDELAAIFADRPQMLCIVNSRAHARDLFGKIADQPGARHLTTLMCVAHRREVLAAIRADLKKGRPVRLVSTSLVEAGVDVDFPEVWRAAAGLDSIAQAAGRCNREGRLDRLGRAIVFEPADHPVPRAFRQFWQAARGPLAMAEPLGLEAVRAYFANLYFHRGIAALDAKAVGGKAGILNAIKARAPDLDFPFASVAAAFRMIDEVTEPVIVPWDKRAEQALEELALDKPPTRDLLRVLQQYVVPVSKADRGALLAAGVAYPVGPNRDGNPFIRLDNKAMYDERIGFMPRDRTAESGIIG